MPDARRVGGRRTACRCNGYRSRAVAIKLTKWSIYDIRARARGGVCPEEFDLAAAAPATDRRSAQTRSAGALRRTANEALELIVHTPS